MTRLKLRYCNLLILQRSRRRARPHWQSLRHDRGGRCSWRSRWHPRHRFQFSHRRGGRR